MHCAGCLGLFGIPFVTFEQIEEDDLTNAAYESASSFFTNDTVRENLIENIIYSQLVWSK